MATYVIKGYAAADAVVGVSTFSLRGDWTAPSHALTFTITDDDTLFGGDSGADNIGDDSTQDAVATTATGNTVASGRVYLEESRSLSDGEGVTITVYTVKIGNTVLGYVTSAPLTPGVSYTHPGSVNVTGANNPSYSALHSATWDQSGVNTLDGGAGNDSLYGGASGDSIVAGAGNDSAWGGTGNDSIFGNDGNDLAYGGDGADSLDGGFTGNDSLYGDAGDDTLIGGPGTDDLYGGEGSDNFLIDNSHQTTNAYGGSTGTDDDAIWLSTWGGASGVSATWTATNTGTYSFSATGASGSFSDIEVWGGTNYADTFNAASSTGPEKIFAHDGNDSLTGGSGNDTLWGMGGNDTIVAGTGADYLDGGDGNDNIHGNYYSSGVYTPDGADLIYGGAGLDTLAGDDGADTIYGGIDADDLWGFYGADSLFGGDGNDKLWGEYDNDFLLGEAGTDSLYGGAGIDTLEGGTGGDLLDGGTGLDLASYATSGAGVSINLQTNTASGGDAAGDTLTGIDGVVGSSYGDTLQGFDSWSAGPDPYTNVFYGAAGSDQIYGAGGNDSLYGGDDGDTVDGGNDADLAWGDAGNDSVSGGAGADTLYGGTGADTLFGGTETDSLYGGDGADSLDGGDGADLLAGDADADTLTGGLGADTLYGGTGADRLDGGDGDDVLAGDADADTLAGGAGADSLDGGSGQDSVDGGADGDTLRGGADADTVRGAEGADSVLGDAGDDLLTGDAGADTLRGGAGSDLLIGGAGNDRFFVEVAGGSDTVADFDLSDDDSDGKYNDQIDVSDLTAPGGGPIYARHVTVSDDGFGNAVLTFPGGETLVLTGIAPSQMSKPGQLMAAGIPCFVAGTRIDTPRGAVRVESLAVGDLVTTLAGPAPILWIASRQVMPEDMRSVPALRPVHFATGVLGNRQPVRLSGQHGVLWGESLVRAAHLARLLDGVRVGGASRPVRYHHLLLPRHGLLCADGLVCESFYPGPMALAALHPGQRAGLLARLPGLAAIPRGAPPLAIYGRRARPLASWPEAQRLVLGQGSRKDVQPGPGGDHRQSRGQQQGGGRHPLGHAVEV